ncbi:MAG: glycoside hydrolase [Planctomycetota bacterium]
MRSFMYALVFLATWTTHSPASVTVRISLDPTTKHQTIHGFGASAAWWVNWFDRIDEGKQTQALDLLFTEAGADLDIIRVNIPSASGADVTNPKRRTPDIETSPGVYDLSRDSKSLSVMKAAVDRGASTLVLFANSPPRRLTRNGRTSGGDGGGSNLAIGAEPEFATYLVDVAEAVRYRFGFDRVRLSPINEPQWRWGEDDRRRWQEGTHYSPAEARSLIRAVVDEVSARDLADRIKLEVFDSGSWAATPTYAAEIWTDPVIKDSIGSIAIHSYWSSPENKRETRAWLDEHLPDLAVIQSEYCEMRGGHDPGMRSALHVARVIHDDLVIGRATEWVWWLGMSSSRFCDGLIHVWLNTEEKKLEVTRRLWALAHWSRFVKPGWARINVSASTDRLRVSAFVSPDSRRLVCVIINESDASVAFSLEADGATRWSEVERFVTDRARKLKPEKPSATSAARSLTTVVLESG